jgi:hypothetical protein
VPTENILLLTKQGVSTLVYVKSVPDTRPIFLKRDETIRGHVFCIFPAMMLRKELDRHLEAAEYGFEWEDINRDPNA